MGCDIILFSKAKRDCQHSIRLSIPGMVCRHALAGSHRCRILRSWLVTRYAKSSFVTLLPGGSTGESGPVSARLQIFRSGMVIDKWSIPLKTGEMTPLQSGITPVSIYIQNIGPVE
jgi:hypothetical protein